MSKKRPGSAQERTKDVPDRPKLFPNGAQNLPKSTFWAILWSFFRTPNLHWFFMSFLLIFLSSNLWFYWFSLKENTIFYKIDILKKNTKNSQKMPPKSTANPAQMDENSKKDDGNYQVDLRCPQECEKMWKFEQKSSYKVERYPVDGVDVEGPQGGSQDCRQSLLVSWQVVRKGFNTSAPLASKGRRISNFNWPGLGPARLGGGRSRCGGPQPWPILSNSGPRNQGIHWNQGIYFYIRKKKGKHQNLERTKNQENLLQIY